MNNYFIDTHSHLDMIDDVETSTIVSDAEKENVKKIIIPTINEENFDAVLNICNKYDNVYCLLGIFPNEAKTWTDKTADNIKNLAKNNSKVVGIGEIGLDYYWDTSYVELQKEIFIKQIELANELNLPIEVHDREAHKDTLDILKKYCCVIIHYFQ